ncbi:ADP-ribosylglycohydrolase family protein, partial [Methanoculleus chikugoensis]|uniref:ADP-ribosylglycohydrolase family protein n=1 Tax=Methanoculleus chikugoensis TaxID=118126 RepID=UPI001FB47ECE
MKPGQFTDDTQMMLLVAGMLADGTYSEQAYAAALARMYMHEELRFPTAPWTPRAATSSSPANRGGCRLQHRRLHRDRRPVRPPLRRPPHRRHRA